ncbi:MAG: RHS repeat-associated core domain-containing protein [Desulfobacula sp.]|nr:RHS repeat-associated core domain-containing protein [Desulfobacula sp.]
MCPGGYEKQVPRRGRCIRVYPGQYYDAETGLHYNYHRYYDPMTGRYLTPDPIGLAGGINPFVYAENNPVNLIDPEGLNPFGNLFNSIRFAGQEINPFARKRKAIENLPTPSQLIATHYNRNDYNQMISYREAQETWNGDVPALFHQLPGWSFEMDNLSNQKFVSPDGKSELVFDSNGNLVLDSLNMGTYNFVSPLDDKFGHFLYDMLPYFMLGNCPTE